MPNKDNSLYIAEQYTDDKNLSTRMRLHSLYSTAKINLYDWLFTIYKFNSPCRILELGCGNASQWEGHTEFIPNNSILVLSDLSCGMVETAWDKFKDSSNIIVQRVDIQDIPFSCESFDVVIANHMLYHVPNLDKALAEVKRVLKPDGVFYSATNGDNGIPSYLHDKLKKFNPKLNIFNEKFSFSLQNGSEILGKYFNSVNMVEHENSLHITETQPLIDWIMSTIAVSGIASEELEGLFEYFDTIRKQCGAIDIPKEAGLFISRK